MNSPLALFGAFGPSWMAPALLIFAMLSLEVERWWTHARRRRNARPGAVAYFLDGVAILSAVMLVLYVLLVVVSSVRASADWFVREVTTNPWALAGALVGGVAVLSGLGLALSRRRGRASRVPISATAIRNPVGPAAPTNAAPTTIDVAATPSISTVVVAPPPVVSAESYNQMYSASVPKGDVDDIMLPSVSMLSQRARPVSSPQPQSFFDIVETKPAAPPPARPRRSRLVPILIGLLVSGVLSGVSVFRHQLAEGLAGLAPAGSEGASVSVPVATTRPVEAKTIPTSAAPAAATPVAPAPDVPSFQTRHVKSDTLNMRVAPGTDQEVVMVLTKGAQVIVLNETHVLQDTIWVKVRVGKREGWVSQRLLE